MKPEFMDNRKNHDRDQHSMYIGRFQPFHHGHLNNIKHILAQGEKPLIVLGSAQHSRQDRHPFNVAERTALIINTLHAEGIKPDDYHITCIEDINDDEKWPQYLEDNLPPFTKVYTGSDKVKNPLEKDGRYKVVPVPFTDGISATKIRDMIRDDRPEWEELVHEVVAKHLKEKDLLKHIKYTVL